MVEFATENCKSASAIVGPGLVRRRSFGQGVGTAWDKVSLHTVRHEKQSLPEVWPYLGRTKRG